MIIFEIKKIFAKMVNKIAIALLAVLILGVSFQAVNSVMFVDKEGNELRGIKAAHYLKIEKNKWAGYLTESQLSKVIQRNTEINTSQEYLSGDYRENNKAEARKQSFSDIKDMLNLAFSPIENYNFNQIDSIVPKEAGNLYKKRISNLEETLNSDEEKDYFSEDEKNFMLTQYKELETPFYYEYFDGWKALLENMSTVILLTMLIAGFLVSSIFSNEFLLKSDSVFFSTKYGRNKAVAAKIGAGFLIITVIYWGAIILYSVVVLGALGLDGSQCPIQIDMNRWYSFYNISFFQEYVLTTFGGYLGSLFILTFSMIVSAITHSTVVAVTIPFIVMIIPSLLSGIPGLTHILGLLPDQLLQVKQMIISYGINALYHVGTNVMGALPIVMMLYFILYCLLVPALYCLYKRMKVE